jgi:hypothetical protein
MIECYHTYAYTHSGCVRMLSVNRLVTVRFRSRSGGPATEANLNTVPVPALTSVMTLHFGWC